MNKYIDLAKAIKMLQKDRFYALFWLVAGNTAAYWIWRIVDRVTS